MVMEMSAYAPVALFIFNRPKHLARTLASLAGNRGFDQSPVFVFADGPRSAADEAAAMAARKVARDFLGTRAEYRFRAANAGLSASIIAGVTELAERFGRVIVVEDDLQLAPGFLAFMNEALLRFADCADVYQVSGYMYAAPHLAAGGRAVFLPIISTWGWGTWRRAWKTFDDRAAGWEQLRSDRPLRQRFNFEGSYDYSAMLERQMRGAVDSWGIRWYWSVFQRGGVVCYPPQSLVKNLGMDGSGTHGRGILRKFSTLVPLPPAGEISFPAQPVVNDAEVAEVRRAIWQHNGGWLGYAANRLRALQWAVRRD